MGDVRKKQIARGVQLHERTATFS